MRHWIKSWVSDYLTGPLRFDFTPEERDIAHSLELLAADCSHDGIIAGSDGTGYPHSTLAVRLNVRLSTLERTLGKLKTLGKVTEDTAGIHITDWRHIAPDYDRQYRYRQAKKRSEDPNKYTGGKYGHVVKQ